MSSDTPGPETCLTLAALDREIGRLQHQLDGRLHGLHQQFTAQLEFLKEALRDLSSCQDSTRDEKLATMQLRFELIERQRVEQKADNQKAIDASLASARESLANLADTYQTGHVTLLAQVDEIRNRLTAMEAMRTTGEKSSSRMIAVISVGLTMAYLVATVVLTLFVHH